MVTTSGQAWFKDWSDSPHLEPCSAVRVPPRHASEGSLRPQLVPTSLRVSEFRRTRTWSGAEDGEAVLAEALQMRSVQEPPGTPVTVLSAGDPERVHSWAGPSLRPQGLPDKQGSGGCFCEERDYRFLSELHALTCCLESEVSSEKSPVGSSGGRKKDHCGESLGGDLGACGCQASLIPVLDREPAGLSRELLTYACS
ncbi:unnamed protein product [Rangifer tarandus platyrhynchus]|uniref:Uncharacterized protein n=1 Tax=Rangifer tarandus platyrhynchus TaxID=3082113 RepID=A0ABN8Y7P0_RANTA|nr:unnamed protein product [Rangifer tarandus platyrhynchus]